MSILSSFLIGCDARPTTSSLHRCKDLLWLCKVEIHYELQNFHSVGWLQNDLKEPVELNPPLGLSLGGKNE